MASKTTTFFRRIFLIAGIFYSLIYLVSCLTPYINPIVFWPLTFLSLGFPFLLGGMILLFLTSLWGNRKYSWLLLLIIAVGFKNISAVFAFNIPEKFQQRKTAGSIRVLSWNVNNFINCEKINDTPGNPCSRILNFIGQSDADILCLQDFSNFYGPDYRSTFDYIRDSLGYRYSYFPDNYSYNPKLAPEQYGTPVFSRYPISDTGKVIFTETSFNESLVYVIINVNGESVKIFNTHLLSMDIHTRNVPPPSGENFLKSDTALMFHSNTFRKLKRFDKIHIQQVQQVKAVLNKSNLPFIFCADLNSVPTTYAYHQLSYGLKDAFLCTGFGLGRTYDSISSTLRIDVVLMSKVLKPVQHYTSHVHVSDHFPNIADILIK
jgi:endonuclease/exonuclease/phosphatase family metal-dependent hydrolase